jgi:hypothetical protein
MIELLLPALFVAARYVVAEGTTRVFAHQLARARHAAVRAVNEIFISTVVSVVINVSVLLVAIHGLRDRLPGTQLVLVISTVYAASVLHAALKLAANAYWISELSRYLLRHGVHGPKAWLRFYVARTVQTRFQQMGALRRLAYRFSGAPRPIDLIEILTREIWTLVAAKLVAIVVIVVVYIAIFSLYTRPILVKEVTHLNWLQAFLWPFGFAIDHFLDTRTTVWIETALDIW